MKNQFLLTCLFSVVQFFVLGQNAQLDWAINIGNMEDDEVKAVVHDSLGNVYLLGEFKGTVDFDHGPNTVNVTSAFSGGATNTCLLYTSPSPRDRTRSRMPSSA